jgi:hypothetical protein
MSAIGGIVLKKSFLTNERKFLGPLMRLVRCDVRDHIVTPKIEHGSSWRRYRALQRQGSLRISFREIFDAAQFSSFSTVSGAERTWAGHRGMSAFDPSRTLSRLDDHGFWSQI